jgi:hypothetical protein
MRGDERCLAGEEVQIWRKERGEKVRSDQKYGL